MCTLLVTVLLVVIFFFFSSRRRHTRCIGDWSSDVCSSDLDVELDASTARAPHWRCRRFDRLLLFVVYVDNLYRLPLRQNLDGGSVSTWNHYLRRCVEVKKRGTCRAERFERRLIDFARCGLT